MNNKLNEMWTALATYQHQADANGHGESWALMCSEKTSSAAYDACDAVYAIDAAADAVYVVYATDAAYAAYDAAYADACAAAATADAAADNSICYINKAIYYIKR